MSAAHRSDRWIHCETLTSSRTEALFVALAILSLRLARWRQRVAGGSLLGKLFAGSFFFFVFYALNYRTLVICLTPEALQLQFGLFHWTISLDNVERCFRDETSLWRIGGAGVHFSFIGGRYRAMLNFLEHPQVVVALRQKRGPVQDVAFSTQQPERVLVLIEQAIAQRS